MLLLQCVVAVEVFIIIAVFPVLFDNLSFNLSEYIQAIFELNVRVITFSEFFTADGRNSLFTVIFYRYFDSMKMLALSFITACVIAFFIAYTGLIFFKDKLKRLNLLLQQSYLLQYKNFI